MTLQALSPPRFVRRTQLGPGEYRRNFRQIDADVIAAVTSREADGVTPLMSKIYLRLISAPPEFWEREGVLYFAAKEADGCLVKSSKVLYELLGVASATAHKALGWMHEQSIIGYFAGKNGAGIRIFLNRASGSIGVRAEAAGKKILPFSGNSTYEAPGSPVEPAFNDSYADLEVLEKDLNPRAPKNGAEAPMMIKPASKSAPTPAKLRYFSPHHNLNMATPEQVALILEAPIRETVSRLIRELRPSLQSVARKAAAEEHERTREWLESKGLPKAARVAQQEAYNVLRKHGAFTEVMNSSRQASVGRGKQHLVGPHPLAGEEIEELAQACVALLETQGQPIDVTLSEMSITAGGFLLADDIPRVRERAEMFSGVKRKELEAHGERSETL
jgi:hypothetical protein